MMWRVLKVLAFSIGVCFTSPLIAFVRGEAVLLGTEALFVGLAQTLALVPTRIGTVLRAAFYWGTLRRCSWETSIGFGSFFSHRESTVASNVSTGAYCVIGHADIGRGVMMGSRVSIPSGKRQHFDDDGVVRSEVRFDRVAIGERCWIGEGAIVMADVGSDSIVSAGAVVVHEVPGRCIAGGNPARVLRTLAGPAPICDSEHVSCSDSR